MADEEKNDVFIPPASGDDELLEDLNISDMDGLSDEAAEGGRPLPKKVELDIDDMMLEEEDEEEPEEPEPEPEPEPEEIEEPAPEPEEEPKKKKGRLSLVKLIILALAVIIPLVAAAGVYKWYSDKKAAEAQKKQAAPIGPILLELKAFVINYPGAEQDQVVRLTMALTFPTPILAQEFKVNEIKVRNSIYLFLQGQGPEVFNDSETKAQLIDKLKYLINGNLSQGKINKIQLLSIEKV